MTGPYVKKGTRVRAQWLEATDACLAGAMPKVGAKAVEVVGTVTGVSGDHPTAPTKVWVLIAPDGGGAAVEVLSGQIVEVFE